MNRAEKKAAASRFKKATFAPMAQKFKNGALVKVKGNSFPVLMVRRYDATFEKYLCSAGATVSSYKIMVKESDMTLLTADEIPAKTSTT